MNAASFDLKKGNPGILRCGEIASCRFLATSMDNHNDDDDDFGVSTVNHHELVDAPYAQHWISGVVMNIIQRHLCRPSSSSRSRKLRDKAWSRSSRALSSRDQAAIIVDATHVVPLCPSTWLSAAKVPNNMKRAITSIARDYRVRRYCTKCLTAVVRWATIIIVIMSPTLATVTYKVRVRYYVIAFHHLIRSVIKFIS